MTPYRGPADPLGPPCPRCAAPSDEATGRLRRDAVGETTVYRCRWCEGVWVARDVFLEVRVDMDRWEEILRREPADGSEEAGVRYLRCPECQSVMARRIFGRRSGVVVDGCGPHGLWFDRGELHRAVAFLRDATLDRAGQTPVETEPVDGSPAKIEPVDSAAEGPVPAVYFAPSRPVLVEVLEALWESLFPDRRP